MINDVISIFIPLLSVDTPILVFIEEPESQLHFAYQLLITLAFIYVFEGKVIRTMNRNIVYPPKECQEKLQKLHGKKVKDIEESD